MKQRASESNNFKLHKNDETHINKGLLDISTIILSKISFILEKDKGRKKEIFDKIIVEMSSNILPVRNGRHYKRTKGQLSGTYQM